MKKRKYQSPQMEVASIESMQIICVSTGGTEQYEDGVWSVNESHALTNEGLSIEW